MSFQILAFYKFTELNHLDGLKRSLKSAMSKWSVKGTFIIAREGFNSTISGTPEDLKGFVMEIEKLFETEVEFKSSFHSTNPFKRQKVKIKNEIVTLRKDIDIRLAEGTHVDSERFNELLSDPDTIVLDTRNNYEFKIGSFKNAVNPEVKSFTELPAFVEANLDPDSTKRVAMFCTGGIRCEKFAPYLKKKGFSEVYQLRGGILRYLEEMPASESMWEGECFVFDERISVNAKLEKGDAADLSVCDPDCDVGSTNP